MATPFLQNHDVHNYPIVATTTTPQGTTVFDMTGWEGLVLIGGRSTTLAEASGGFSFSQGTASGSLSQTTGIQNLSLTTIALECFRPTMQFVKGTLLVTTTTTGGSNPAMIAIRYGPKTKPVVMDASTTGKIIYSPGTGTATG